MIHILPPLFPKYKLKLGLSKNGKWITKTVIFNIIVETTLFDIFNKIQEFVASDEFASKIKWTWDLDFIKDQIYNFLHINLNWERLYVKDKLNIKIKIFESSLWVPVEWKRKIEIVCHFKTKTGEKISRPITRYLN